MDTTRMRTKKIRLFYTVSDKEIFPPPQASITRKDAWIREVQNSIDGAGKVKTIEVQYRVFNPEVEAQQKYFNGPVIDYWVIQGQELLDGEIPRIMHDQARETLLSNVLGYEVTLIDRKERRRKSTADFNDTQEWNDFLETLKETEFEPQGYEMPDSKGFWELVEKYGYNIAQGMAIMELRRRMKAKLSTPE